MILSPMIQLLRPSHWVKNVVVLIPLVMGVRVNIAEAWLQAAMALVAFCFISSATYVLNDIIDVENDRHHPKKKLRPLASGDWAISKAWGLFVLLFILAMLVAGSLSALFFIVVMLYMVLQVGYTFYIKQVVLLDVICIAIGFVMRAVGGAVAISVVASHWLFVCMFTLFLFMGFCKRYNENVHVEQRDQAKSHRATLVSYTPELLSHIITLTAGIAVVGFLLYSVSDRTVNTIGTVGLVYTLPLVIYAVFRFAMLSMSGRYMDPTDIVLKDRPFQGITLAWCLVAATIVFRGEPIAIWAEGLY
jgi:4-hydroxybenzoate polyprenyltransferase